MCGMQTVMIVLFVEWPIFLLLAAYLDQVLDTGHGVPRHPLFVLGYEFSSGVAEGAGGDPAVAAGSDAEAEGGSIDKTLAADVVAEEQRVSRMLSRQESDKDAVIVNDIAKTYPAHLGKGPKVAVRSLSLGVPHGWVHTHMQAYADMT